MFKILIDNKNVAYESISLIEKFNSLSNECSISFIGAYDFNFNNKTTIKYKDSVVLNGFIDIIEENKSGSNINTNISCREATGDIIDSTIGVITKKINYNFLTLIKELTGLDTINQSAVANFSIPYTVKSELGEPLAYFLNSIARTFKVFLSCTAEGKILISSLNTNTSEVYIINDYISYRQSNNIQNLYNKYTCYSQSDFSNNNLTTGAITDNNIRSSRTYAFESELSLNTTKQAQDLALRKKQLNSASQKFIEVEIPFTKMLHVNSYAQLNKIIYFIDEITYNISNNNAIVRLKLVDKDVYL